MKSPSPGHLFVESFLITNLILLLVIGTVYLGYIRKGTVLRQKSLAFTGKLVGNQEKLLNKGKDVIIFVW